LYETDDVFVAFDFHRRLSFRCRTNRTASADNLWREIDDANLQRRQLPRPIIPHAYRAFTLGQKRARQACAEGSDGVYRSRAETIRRS
jgi:hypothetical protein